MVSDSIATQHARRTALVTGGGSGIGRASAVALAASGMDVLVIGRRQQALQDTADLHPGIRYLVGDITEAEDIAAAVRVRSEEHTSELQSRQYLVCRLLLEKKHKK